MAGGPIGIIIIAHHSIGSSGRRFVRAASAQIKGMLILLWLLAGVDMKRRKKRGDAKSKEERKDKTREEKEKLTPATGRSG